jgi:hypothetical protein
MWIEISIAMGLSQIGQRRGQYPDSAEVVFKPL